MSGSNADVFRQDVREEWIDAMFGRDFYSSKSQDPAYKPPKQGIGLAGFSSYVTFSATIPAQKEVRDTKIGITICRIPLGVYVRMVETGSEAHAAGIVEGSVLLDVNGIGVLGEPSHKLLERLWFHEGHCSPQDYSVKPVNENNLHEQQAHLSSRGPVSLRFIKNGQMYSVILFSRASFGISWAPCGNFALIQRTYSHAAVAGMARGCIVASVNNKNLRTLDHTGVASELKSQFTAGNEIQIVGAYTALTSRIASSESDMKNKKSRNHQKMTVNHEITTGDGVRIRKVNQEMLEYGLGTFFTCGVSKDMQQVSEGTKRLRLGKVSEFAIKVASGERIAPSGWKQPWKHAIDQESSALGMVLDTNNSLPTDAILPEIPVTFPVTKDVSIVLPFDALGALLFCLQMDLVNYRDDQFFKKWSLLWNENTQLLAPRAKVDVINIITRSDQDARRTRNSLALQMVSLLASKEFYESCLNQIKKSGANKGDDKEPGLFNEEASALHAELASSMIDAATMDDDFCQTLHFLLRTQLSIIARKRDSSDGSGFSSAKLLATTHRQLINRLMDLESNTSKNNKRSESSFSDLQESSTLASLSALSLSSDISTLNQKKNKIGKNLTTFFQSKKQSLKGDDLSCSTSRSQSPAQNGDGITTYIAASKIVTSPSPSKGPKSILKKGVHPTKSYPLSVIEVPHASTLFENMNVFLSSLDSLCVIVEKALLKSFSQKLTEWALQPWSLRKDKALADATTEMRNGLVLLDGGESNESPTSKGKWSPIINPINSSEYLVSIDSDKSYILPSAHFPILLSFRAVLPELSSSPGFNINSLMTKDASYGVKVEFLSVRDNAMIQGTAANTSYIVHAAIAGIIQKTEKCVLEPYYDSSTYRWQSGGTLSYNIRSTWGYPRTLSLRLASVNRHESYSERSADEIRNASEVGYAYIDLSQLWTKVDVSGRNSTSVTVTIPVWSFMDKSEFDNSGYLPVDESFKFQNFKIELRLSLSASFYGQTKNGFIQHPIRLLLYKHDDDVRQEMLAIQFIEICDQILKSSGLDLKIRTYRCMPVAEKRGFIEWVPGTVSMSEVCKPVGSDSSALMDEGTNTSSGDNISGAFLRLGDWCKHESLRSLRTRSLPKDKIGLSGDNPVQEFLRASSFDKEAPYLIRKDVMDTYIKSCAGYSVITYLLGVGDRHTDNLLLHPDGTFLHCDYSFILGQDPKKYLPMRVTTHMVNGMGGCDSDNFSKFLSLAGAAFTALREHTSVRTLLSLVRNVSHSNFPSLTVSQTADDALRSMLHRFRLDLSNDEAVEYMEELIHGSMNSKLWLAVDAMHDLGKRF